jgi:hypothetical protein
MSDIPMSLSLDYALLSVEKSIIDRGMIHYPYAFGYLRAQLEFALSIMTPEQLQKMQEKYNDLQRN